MKSIAHLLIHWILHRFDNSLEEWPCESNRDTRLPEGARDIEDLVYAKNMPYWLGFIFKNAYTYSEESSASKHCILNCMLEYIIRASLSFGCPLPRLPDWRLASERLPPLHQPCFAVIEGDIQIVFLYEDECGEIVWCNNSGTEDWEVDCVAYWVPYDAADEELCVNQPQPESRA